ncbi:MAG: redox-sensing transcriptional repressor Rex [Clostridia bacterium]|nr:redox-sensing transcriptional repressor Rex [Clostridia bacterium]
MKQSIPLPVLERLSILYTVLERLEKEGRTAVSSAELGRIMNVTPHTIRKDINYFGQAGSESGYSVSTLRNTLEKGLRFDVSRKACIVGLGRMGLALMNFSGFKDSNIRIEAGFDSNINRLETLKTDIELYPAYEIPEVVKRKSIELGVITVPPEAAQQTADKLIQGGIKGIINFAPVIIQCDNPAIAIRNFYVLEEFRILSALIQI